MKFSVKNPRGNILSVGRKIGYILQRESSPSEVSFTRPLERGGYPRFHLYVRVDGEELILNLHLDQKKPVYKGAHDHAAEYEGALVNNEAERIKKALA